MKDNRLNDLEERRAIYDAARNFEEGERVPVVIRHIGTPFLCWLFGYNWYQYYWNRDVQWEVRVNGAKWVYEVLKDDRFPGVIGCKIVDNPPAFVNDPSEFRLDLGAVSEGIVFDCDIRMPTKDNPWVSPWIIPKLKTPEDVEKLEVPDIKDVNKRLEEWIFKIHRKRLKNLTVGIHPPLSAAGSLMGMSRLYPFLYRYPKLMHKLLGKLLETYFLLVDYRRETTGTNNLEEGDWSLGDDHSGFLNEKMYRGFVLPYNRRIYERYAPKGWRHLHVDSCVTHIAHILRDEMKLNSVDIAKTDIGCDLTKAKKEFDGRVVMHGGFNGGLLVAGSRETIEREVERCIRTAAPGGGYIFDVSGEGVMPKIDVDKLLYMVKYAKKIGRYPIRIE